MNGSFMGLSVALGGVAFRVLGGLPGQIELSSALAAFVVGPLVHQIANNFFVAFGLSRWRETPFVSTWLSGVRDLLGPNLLSIPTAAFLAVLYTKVHYLWILAYLVLLWFQWEALRLYIKRRQLYAQIVDGLVVATDVNFPLSRGHARRVADLAVAISREMGLSETRVESIQFAALLHDVGMIGKDDLLDRPILTAEDLEGLLDHVRVGAEVARELPRKEIATLILRHHEKYDGTGYPTGLKGEAIPHGARVLALAEAVDSMSSGGFPYNAPLSPESVRAHVAAERGRAFDPGVVDAFLRTLDKGSIALSPSGSPESTRVPTAKLGGLPVT